MFPSGEGLADPLDSFCGIYFGENKSNHRGKSYAVHIFFAKQSNNIMMIAPKIIYTGFNAVIQPAATIMLVRKSTALCILIYLEHSIFFHI